MGRKKNHRKRLSFARGHRLGHALGMFYAAAVSGAAAINSEMLTYEIGRLRALCKKHNIDPDLPKGGEIIPLNKTECLSPAMLAAKGDVR